MKATISGIAIFGLLILSLFLYDKNQELQLETNKQHNRTLVVYTQDLIYGLKKDDEGLLKLTLAHFQGSPPRIEDIEGGKEMLNNYESLIKGYLNEERSEAEKENILTILETVFQILVESEELRTQDIEHITKLLSSVRHFH
ncbi:hypothetical protein [Pseudalkalibacillus sp. SCS-8]|uniref:hypothetical protein n=1 Tax=Pseudalkalibacillus nanhaiensis TaxID=3115291 RepID=UPI0032DAE9BD